MRHLITVMMLVVGVIHLLPLPGVLGAESLAALYGLDFRDANLTILMRHRAILFGMLGAFCVAAAFRRQWQVPAALAAGISLLSFLLLAMTSEGYNAAIGRVVTADIVALACLLVAVPALRWTRRQTGDS
ncbi:hypothetical protein [Tahibacter amnicola]|uniref:Phosphopantetheine adenylyltransferase n=1 Tax=Tahibacter amnicola TaxID=2976241 RepID=A0ABY6BNT6_9GAMM|nr:hypothetical protein [Tahibacter amnicola]UXI70226.1 hypothetical protein N4264_11505 [Tahibacter amnicola]